MPDEEHHEPQHEVVIDVRNVTKDFVVGKNIIPVLKGIDLQIRASDFMVIYGPSGCGKSTLFNIILGLEEPTSGEVEVRETKIYDLSDDERAKFREKKIGMIYQTPYWIKSLNVAENIAFPLIIEGIGERAALKESHRVMEEIGIMELARQIPTQLSGGEQQKVGLARALVANPRIVLADEPTGNLDTTSGDEILAILQKLNIKHKRTIVIVTHNSAYWGCGNRRIQMQDGQIVKEDTRKE